MLHLSKKKIKQNKLIKICIYCGNITDITINAKTATIVSKKKREKDKVAASIIVIRGPPAISCEFTLGESPLHTAATISLRMSSK